MLAAYLTCTCLAALACAYAVYLNVTRAKLVIDTAHRLDIPVSLMVPFGILLGSSGRGYLPGSCRGSGQSPQPARRLLRLSGT